MTGPTAVVRVTNEKLRANTYLCPTGDPGTCLLIDPGSDAAAIATGLEEHCLEPIAILCTHGHFDHIGNVDHFMRRYSIPAYLHSADAPTAASANFKMMAMKLTSRVVVPEAFTLIDGASSMRIAGAEVIHAPGHTPGSVVVRVGDAAFTGDTLYRSETWRTPWPEEDEDQLVASLRSLWDRLPDDTVVYPGHGGSVDFATIKRTNEPLRRLLGLSKGVTR